MNEEYGCCCTSRRRRRGIAVGLYPNLPEPDVIVYDVDGTTPMGRAYSFYSPYFDVAIEDLAGNVTYYAASAPLLNKLYVPRTDLAGNITHYLLAI